jgi:hypothetical protein
VLEENLLTREQLESLLRIEAMTAPSRARPMRGAAPTMAGSTRQMP